MIRTFLLGQLKDLGKDVGGGWGEKVYFVQIDQFSRIDMYTLVKE